MVIDFVMMLFMDELKASLATKHIINLYVTFGIILGTNLDNNNNNNFISIALFHVKHAQLR